ncbi:hypothetical protein COBT_000491 [Conglomerata obtusa]
MFFFALIQLSKSINPKASSFPQCIDNILHFPDGSTGGPCYENGAVSTEVPQCSELGVEILKHGGNALDAAIASCICVGIVNSFSSGIGGGGFLLIKTEIDGKEVIDSVDFRETAPMKSKVEQYQGKNDLTKKGGRAVGVPGEIRGLYEAHKKYGRMQWKDLFKKNIEIANGFAVSDQLYKRLVKLKTCIFEDPGLKEIYTRNGELVKPNDVICRKNYARTLEIISENPNDFYEGRIAKNIVECIKKEGGVIELEDLKKYKAIFRDIIEGEFMDYKVYTTSLPTSGLFIIEALNILENFDLFDLMKQGEEAEKLEQDNIEKQDGESSLKPNDQNYFSNSSSLDSKILGTDDLNGLQNDIKKNTLYASNNKITANTEEYKKSNLNNSSSICKLHDKSDLLSSDSNDQNETNSSSKTTTENSKITKLYPHYHLLVEVYKFMTAKRGLMADPKFMKNHKSIIEEITNKDVASEVAKKININKTLPESEYGFTGEKSDDHGTTHLNVVDKDNSFVLITSTINLEFGAKFMCKKTGIIFNDEIDDFYVNNIKNAFELACMKRNVIEPGKRPFSSAAPFLLVKHNEIIALGAAGGTRIPTSLIGIIFHLMLGKSLSESIAELRIHNQFHPDKTYIESGLDKGLIDYLNYVGHKTEESALNSIFTSVQGIHVIYNGNDKIIEAVSDKRKGGLSMGY